MTASLLVDTSFLITLANPARPNNAIADRFFREAIRTGSPLLLSTLAISEFHRRQNAADLPLRNFRVVPFNIDHAMTAAELTRQIRREPEDDRASVFTDIKLIGQAICEGATHVLTEDERTLAKYVRALRQAGTVQMQPVLLVDGFDSSVFNEGQHGLLDD